MKLRYLNLYYLKNHSNNCVQIIIYYYYKLKLDNDVIK